MISHKFDLIKTSHKSLALIILNDYHKYILYFVVVPPDNSLALEGGPSGVIPQPPIGSKLHL